MAKTDIMGLLTGVSSQGLDPMTALTPAQQRMEFGARRAKGLTGAVRGMLGGGASIQEQLATGVLKKQLEQQQAMTDLDLSNPEDLMKLAKVQQASGDLSGAVSTLNTAKQISEQAGLKEGLLNIAKSQGDEEMITFIEAGGDLKTASTKLLGDKTVTGVSSLTENERKEYEDYFDVISDEDLEKAGISTGIFSMFSRDKGVKNRLMYQAEQIYTNAVKQKRKLTRQEALLEAMDMLSSGSSDTTAPTNGATPRRQVQQDKFSNVTAG